MLTSAWKPLRPHPVQSALWRTRSRFVAVRAGRGSGKTEIARRRVVRYLNVKKPGWSDPTYFYALPTFSQAKRVAWPQLKALIPKDWIANINESDLQITTVFGSILYVFGMDKPERAEGLQYDGGVIDESSDHKPTVFTKTLLPTFSHRDGWCWRIGVPKRFGSGAEDFNSFFHAGKTGESIPGCPDLRIESFEWSSEDIVNPEILAFARKHLSQQDYDEQYRALEVGVQGAIFYTFDDSQNVHVAAEYNPDLPVYVGSDFNVDPMAWVLCHKYSDGLDVFDEVWLRNTSTQQTLDHLHKRYGNHRAGFRFIGDASGRARKTSASTAAQSDYLIIKADRRFYNASVAYPKSNPAVVDRFASCNALICNANGERRLLVNPRCKRTIADLNARSYKPGTREPADSGDVGHITDALGYVIHSQFPLTLGTGQPLKMSIAS
jgi:hypothetical protein